MGMFDGVKKAAGGVWDGGAKDIYDPLNIGGTLFGPGPDRPDLSQDQAARDKAIADLKAKMPTSFDQYKYQGDFNPTALTNLPQQTSSQFNQIATDPATRAAQMQALQQLQSRSTDGYNAEDKAAMSQMLSDSAQQEGSQRGALMANMQARGAGGSGAELAQQLAAQQGAATRNNQAALTIGANGRAQALQAAMQSGQLGGQMRQQDYSQDAQRAAAQDSINRFNTQNSVGQAQYNNQLTNQASQQNLANQQSLANKNTDLGNNFQQNQFNNQGKVTDTQYGAATNDANNKLAQYGQQVAAQDKNKDRLIGVGTTAAGIAAKSAGGA